MSSPIFNLLLLSQSNQPVVHLNYLSKSHFIPSLIVTADSRGPNKKMSLPEYLEFLSKSGPKLRI